MEKTISQTRISLVLAGVALGMVARLILGPPVTEVPQHPTFQSPLPSEVPFSVPLKKTTVQF